MPGQVDSRAVLKVGRDDLDTDGKAVGRPADGGDGGGEIGGPREAVPGCLADVRALDSVHGDRASVDGAGLVVLDSGDGRDRREDGVVRLEELRPLRAQPLTVLVDEIPVGGARGDGRDEELLEEVVRLGEVHRSSLLVDVCASRLEGLYGDLKRLENPRIDRADGIVEPDRDPVVGERLTSSRWQP